MVNIFFVDILELDAVLLVLIFKKFLVQVSYSLADVDFKLKC